MNSMQQCFKYFRMLVPLSVSSVPCACWSDVSTSSVSRGSGTVQEEVGKVLGKGKGVCAASVGTSISDSGGRRPRDSAQPSSASVSVSSTSSSPRALSNTSVSSHSSRSVFAEARASIRQQRLRATGDGGDDVASPCDDGGTATFVVNPDGSFTSFG